MGNQPAAGLFPSYQKDEQIPYQQVEGAIPQQAAHTSHLIPALQHQQLSQGFGYGQIPSNAGEIGSFNHPEHMYRPMYGEQSEQVSGYDGELQRAVQHQTTHWGSASIDGKHHQNPNPLSYGTAGESMIQHSSESEGTHSFVQGNPLNQDGYVDLAKDGKTNGGHKMTKHTWTHLSTTGTGQVPHDQKQLMQIQGLNHGESLTQSHELQQYGHIHGSNLQGELSTSHVSDDLTTILNGQPKEQRYELHPSIKQAITNVARDFEDNSGNTLKQPTHHTIHKISHIKKTRVQNIGREPSHIQSTSFNDNINLSDLIKQLQILEESPRHTNITWCEEKIKEFLRTLRRKQDSGVFINQQVQEQTLHHILTQEAVQGTGSNDGIFEPPMTKVTMRPLGGEDLTKSEKTSGFINHEQHHHGGMVDMKNQTQEELSSNVYVETVPEQQEIITVIPDQAPEKLPEIMSHQHESPREPPPFISDNNNELGELELELPEYPKDAIPDTPIKHANAEEVEAFESTIQKETRPLRPLPQPKEEVSGQQQDTTFEEPFEVERRPTQNESSNYESEHKTIHQVTSNNINGNNHHINHYQDVEPAYAIVTQQNTIQSSGQEQKQNSIHHQLNNPEGTEPEISDELDLQLPEYHPISGDLNTPNGFQHPSPEIQLSEIYTKDNGYGQSSFTKEETKEESKIPSHYDFSHHSGNDVNHEYVESVEETHHHIVHGRPNAPLQGTYEENVDNLPRPQENSSELKVAVEQELAMNESQQKSEHLHAQESNTESLHKLHQQQLNYDTLIEELIQLESLPGHQAIDKCEEKIQEFLEILKYQQEQGFGRNQLELERLHQTLIEQAEARSKEHSSTEEGLGGSTLPPTSFWRRVQKKIKKTYDTAKDRAKQVMGK